MKNDGEIGGGGPARHPLARTGGGLGRWGGIGERREPSSPTCSQSVCLSGSEFYLSLCLCLSLSISLLLSYYM